MMTAEVPYPALPTALPTPHEWQWRGFQVKYTVMGEGPPLLLIHGFGASIYHWRKNIPVLAQHSYRVYALDLLGFGQSEKPAINYSLDLWSGLIQDFWRTHIQAPTVFVGNSIGALLVLQLLAVSPDMAAGGVLLNAAGGLNHRPEELKPPLRWVMGAFTKLVSSRWVGPLVFEQIRQKNRIRSTLQQVYGNRAAVTDDLVEALYAPSCDVGAQKVFTSILTAPPGPTIAALLARVQHPLLVLWGEADPWTPITGGQIFQTWGSTASPPSDDLAAVEFHAIPDTGHCPHDERPEIVNPLILEWLQRLIAPTQPPTVTYDPSQQFLLPS